MRTAPRATAVSQPKRTKRDVGAHHTNRPLAEALFAAANGDRITIATAPPGAGKTFLIAHLAHQLSTQMGLRIAIAAQTRAQSYDAAQRVAALGASTRHLRGTSERRPHQLSSTVPSTTPSQAEHPGVTVATSARWRYTSTTEYRADILLVDEAYQIEVPDLLGPNDPALALVADRTARTLLDSTITTDHSRRATPRDVAVIAPHVDQAALISARLTDQPDLFIGTINQAQGLERDIVVAIHPLTGHPEAPDFTADLGRLCVALTRHRSHLSLITEPAVSTTTRQSMPHDDSPRQQVLDIHAAILSTLTSR